MVKNNTIFISFLIMLLLTIISCSLFLPDNRSFYMGFTPFPYDFTTDAINYTYDLINEKGDIIAHHLDEGIPWTEALNDEPYHQNVINQINIRLDETEEGKKIYLAVTPISQGRDALALYWGEEENMTLPAGWETKEFDDPDVITAYLNYCRYMIGEFQPDFFAYGIEVNDLYLNSPDLFDNYLNFINSVYSSLKGDFPDLPVFLSFSVSELTEDSLIAIEDLIPYTDYMAVSYYPYMGGITNPVDIPDNWYQPLIDIAQGKPFAVAETGFLAETLILDDYNLILEGKPIWQNNYLDRLLQDMNEIDAELLIWFVFRDYDLAWEEIKNLGFDELFKIWKDTGLVSGDGTDRIAMDVWKSWLRINKD